MLKFMEGSCVAIKEDKPAFGLIAGATGRVWALYDTDPPAYEITFCAQGGDEFDALMYEDELVEPVDEAGACVRRAESVIR